MRIPLLLLVVGITQVTSLAFAQEPAKTDPPAAPATTLTDALAKCDAAFREEDKALTARMSTPGQTHEQMAQITADWRKLQEDRPARRFVVVKQFAADPAAFDVLREAYMRGGNPQIKAEAWELITRDHVKNPQAGLFCVVLATQQMSDEQEKFIAEVAGQNPDRDESAKAQLALSLGRKGRLDKTPPASPEAKAAQTQELVAAFGRIAAEKGEVKVGTTTIKALADAQVFELQFLSIGSKLPEVEGNDSDGKAIKLTDYAGKVVVLDFWASWCGPCMAMVPHERELVARLKDKPFAFVGINIDSQAGLQKKAEQSNQMSWPSIADPAGKISGQWNIHSIPALFITDGKGIIRYKNLRGAELDKAIDTLLGENASPAGKP